MPSAIYRRNRMRGFSLVELMVALVISLLVLVATVSFYLMTKSTYTTIDDSSNLEERGQFALGLIARALRQTAYTPTSADGGTLQPSINDPDVASISGLDGCDNPPAGERLTACGTGGTNTTNDAIEIRFFGSGTAADRTVPDNTIFDCSGQGVAEATSADTVSTQRGLSILFIQQANGNSFLACKFRRRDAAGHEVTGTTDEKDFVTLQLVPGVESLQFLYGVSTDGDTVPEVYKRASSMSPDDWKSVYAVKVAMVIRADNNTSADTSQMQSYTLFSGQYGDGDGTYKPTQNLGSARRMFTTTVQTRNYQICYKDDPGCF
ncbi:PilW family protein [Ralstonia sp. CHL-2022]|uniref:PilW family protein n=1 Tax=Ralstonia mojiangensis TaxID=2953895 RepID=A0AAE3I5P1_9RALS|nr:PilW family protein [Ralstonia mojiangensis]MCT7317093.1 PilW family protein [Ralstonia mojiangensis]MCT7327721.1 PilW family protein [Ralstonia mojiangensis]